MKERRSRASKVHFQHNGNHRTLCGLDGRTTYMVNNTTCRVCMFHYLAESTSWARRFLDDLRGKPSTGETQRDKDLRERGYHITVANGIVGDVGGRKSPSVTLEYTDANAFRTKVRDAMRQSPTHIALVRLFGELAGAAQGDAVAVPARTAAEADSQEKGLGDGFARAFSQQRSPKKAISELLPFSPAHRAAIQEVMNRGGASADTVGVKEGDVAEDAGNTGKISDEAFGHY